MRPTPPCQATAAPGWRVIQKGRGAEPHPRRRRPDHGADGRHLRDFESAQVSGGTARITVAGRKGSRATCPDLSKAELPGARMVGESVIDLSTLTATPTGTTRCVYAA